MLKKLLKTAHVIMEMKAKGKEEALKELVEQLKLPADKKNLLLDALIKREALGSTGIGKGIAIPHTRSLVVDQVHLVLGLSREGVDFDSLDGEKVHVFFLLVAPPLDPGSVYLITLGQIARLSRRLANSKSYLEAKTKEELVKFLIETLEKEEGEE